VAVRADAVTFRTKSGKAITVTPAEFLRRFLLHVLPARFVKMRHFGLLASGNVPTKLEQERTLLSSRSPSPTAASPSGRDILATLTVDEIRRAGPWRQHPARPHPSADSDRAY
jgi:hypothetical protein